MTNNYDNIIYVVITNIQTGMSKYILSQIKYSVGYILHYIILLDYYIMPNYNFNNCKAGHICNSLSNEYIKKVSVCLGFKARVLIAFQEKGSNISLGKKGYKHLLLGKPTLIWVSEKN